MPPQAAAPCRFVIATPRNPGAIAIIQLIGDPQPVLAALTGDGEWPIGRGRLTRFDDIDAGIAVRLSDAVAQLMPHGGPRILQRLAARLVQLGAEPVSARHVDPRALYPEAADRVEALMLAALSRAQSPLAVDLLLDQPRRWRLRTPLDEADRARSQRLNRLIDPPIVILAGPPNVGKSTLSNALLGRAMSITMDQPGTTRDYVAGRIDLGGLVVDWHDTPGLRASDDPIERQAVHLAARLIERADLLMAMTAPDEDWPALPRDPDLRVLNKADLLPTAGLTSRFPAARKTRIAPDLRISARTGTNLDSLVTAARDRLVPPGDLSHSGPWLFDERLVS